MIKFANFEFTFATRGLELIMKGEEYRINTAHNRGIVFLQLLDIHLA